MNFSSLVVFMKRSSGICQVYSIGIATVMAEGACLHLLPVGKIKFEGEIWGCMRQNDAW